MGSQSLAQTVFEDAVFEHYRGYLRRNDPQKLRSQSRTDDSRGIGDILKRYPATAPLSDELAAVIRGFRDVECLLADYSSDIARIVRHEPAQVQFTMFWTGEEAIHGFALDEVLIAYGANTPREVRDDKARLLTTCKWDPSKVDVRFLDPWYGPMCYVTLQEKVTGNGYRWLRRSAEREGHIGLAKICQRLAEEEFRHHGFYYGMAKLALSYQPDKLKRQMTEVVTDFAMPGRYAIPFQQAETATPDNPLPSALPAYDEWTKTAQRLGIVPDPLFAVPLAARLRRKSEVLRLDEHTIEGQRVACWNEHVASVLQILKGLGIELPRELRYLAPIPVA
ncbi:MAG TPA: acyl-ACP desaturase [Patescibacteria group bacterium]